MAMLRRGVVLPSQAVVRGGAGWGAMMVGERWCDELLFREGLRRCSTVQRLLLRQRDVATRTWWSCCWTAAPTWRPRTA